MSESLRTRSRESELARRHEPDLRWKRWSDLQHGIEHDWSRPRGASRLPSRASVERLADTRAALRSLHDQGVASVLSGHGLDTAARLAASVAGAPVAILIPDSAALVMPFGAVDRRELAEIDSWARERLLGDLTAPPAGVALDVPVVSGGRTVGVVALLRREHEPHDPDPIAAWVLDVTAAVALTAVAVDEGRLEAEHRLRGSFLEQLRSGDLADPSAIARRARRLGCELSHGAAVLCIEVSGNRPRTVAATIAAEYPGAFAEPIERSGADDLPVQVWAVLPAISADVDSSRAQKTEEAARRLGEQMRTYGVVGVSRFHADLTEFARAIDEAELMLDVMRRSVTGAGEHIVEGTYKLLLRLLASHPDELTHYHGATIAPLVQHDEQYRTDLVRTLETYLETNCNMNVTAETIFAHRHTVAHRLERIQELTGLDATLHEDRERLGLGLKIHRLTV